MLIDCDTCAVRGKGCQDCVITVLLNMPGPVELDADERTAFVRLADAGLVPPLRLVPSTGVATEGEGGNRGIA